MRPESLPRFVTRGALVILSAFSAVVVHAQRGPNASDAPPHQYVIEFTASERWLHARSFPPAVPFVTRDFIITIDSVLPDAGTGARTVFLRQGDPRYAKGAGRLVIPATAAPQRAVVPLVENDRPQPGRTPKEMRISFLWRVLADPAQTVGLSLPDENVWDLAPSFHPTSLTPGATWRDTIRARAEIDGLWQEVTGIRTSWLEADSSANGRVRWLVRDSAAVRYRAQSEIPDDDRESNPIVRQEATGTIMGRYVQDVALQLPAWRRDSTRWSGTARLQEPGRPAVSTSAHFERIRTWKGFAPDEYVRMRDARFRERNLRYSGPVRQPKDAWQVRLAARDTALLDSLERVFAASSHVPLRDSITAALPWASWSPGLEVRMRERAVAAGDTAQLLAKLGATPLAFERRYSLADARRLLDWLEDPQRLWDWGIRRSTLTEPLTETLVHRPLALRDTSTWPCDPEACDLLAERGGRSREPLARDLALLLQFSRAPRAHVAQVRRRAVEQPTFFARALYLADGVGAWWDASTKPRVPAPDGDWRDWLRWMHGGETAPFDLRPAGLPRPVLAELPLRFEAGHEHALRMHTLVTGRDFDRELQAAFGAAASDSARFVLGTVWNNLRPTPVPEDTLRDWFRSGSRLLQQLATTEAMLATRPMPPAERRWPETEISRALRDSLLDGALEQLATGAPRWRTPEQVTDSAKAAASGERLLRGRNLAAPRDTLPPILVAEDWPDGLPMRWRAAFRLMSRAELRALPVTQGFVAHSIALTRRGPFVLLNVEQLGQIARPADAARQAFYAYSTFLLLEIDGEWLLVGMQMSMT